MLKYFFSNAYPLWNINNATTIKQNNRITINLLNFNYPFITACLSVVLFSPFTHLCLIYLPKVRYITQDEQVWCVLSILIRISSLCLIYKFIYVYLLLKQIIYLTYLKPVHNPKSVSLICPLASIRILSGLMSLWIKPIL